MEIINLDMTPSTVTPNAHAGQYDSARTVRFMLKNGGVPFTLAGTETITAEITRSDNTDVTVNVANTSSNYVDVVFDDTVCTVKGLYACELRLKDSDGFDIGSKNFALLVQRDPYDGQGVSVETVGPADICTFETNLPEPYQSVTVNVVATGGYDADTQTAHPINGYSSANITRCCVNLCPDNWEQGEIDATTGADISSSNTNRTVEYIPIKGGLSYYVLAVGCTGSARARFYDAQKNYIGYVNKQGNEIGLNSAFEAPDNACFVRFAERTATVPDPTGIFGLNYPSTDTTYHAYNGQTYTIAFGQTVYGGVLDVTRGKLRGSFGDSNLSDITGWSYSNGFFRTSELASIIKKPVTQGTAVNALCSIYNAVSWTACGDNDSEFAVNQSTGELIIKDSRYSDVPSFLAGVSGIPFVYELATPFEIDLTPEVISAIVGVNNVSADCGQTTVKYLKAE